MRCRSVVPIVPAVLAAVLLPVRAARGVTYYVAMNGNDANPGTMAAPFRTPRMAGQTAQAGDIVYFRTGTHPGGIHPTHTGTASAWITFSAAPGELPILDGGGSDSAGFEPQSVVVEYIRVVGLVTRNFNSSGFSNGWSFPSSHIEIRNCVAESNGINGITFYGRTTASSVAATSVLIQNNIIAHNGNMQPSWSSGVNVYQVSGTAADNQIVGNVSFENIDISTHHSDGSGFILDFNSMGALFANNIGFRNGGSCLRVTNSAGAQLVNNTCYHDGLDPTDTAPAMPGEIFFSDTTASTNVLAQNNLLAASGTMAAFNRTTGTGSTFQNNVVVNMNGATPFFTNAAAGDFTIVAGASNVINQGLAANAPATDSGFDPKCIKAQAGQPVSWWQFAPDYTYMANVGGVAGCFHPTARPQSTAPDVGAYEFGGPVPPSTGGAPGSGGAAGAGGQAGAEGAGGAGGATARTGGRTGSGGVAVASGGRTATGGATGTSTGGDLSPGTGGDGGTGAVGPGGSGAGNGAGGCACRGVGDGGGGAGVPGVLGVVLARMIGRARRRRRS